MVPVRALDRQPRAVRAPASGGLGYHRRRGLWRPRRGARRAATALLLALAGCGAGPIDRGAPPRVIVLVSLDTLRADRLGLYGHGRDTDPTLARLARESVVFRTVLSQSSHTLSSHQSLFTSKYPLRLLYERSSGVRGFLDAEEPGAFYSGVYSARQGDSLVRPLREAGYRAVAFTDGGWMAARLRWARYFDEFDDRGGGLAGILPRVDSRLRDHADRSRLFLFVHAYDVHCPFVSRSPYDLRFCSRHDEHIPLADRCGKRDLMPLELTEVDLDGIRDHYDGGISSADAYVADLLDMLEQRGLYDEALIAITSDHGESLGERGMIGHGGLYIEQLRVPLILKLPASWGVPAAVVDEPAALLDVMPTLVDAAGLSVDGNRDGRSLLPVLLEGASGRDHLVAQTAYREGEELRTNLRKRALLASGRWLLIRDGVDRAFELYDLEADPGALRDVSEQEPVLAHRLMSKLHEIESTTVERRFRRPVEVEIDDKLRSELRALGYVE